MIPDARKQDFFKEAATQLRGGYHPNVTVRRLLIEIGVIKPAVQVAAPRPSVNPALAGLAKSGARPSPGAPRPAPRPPAPAVPPKPAIISSPSKPQPVAPKAAKAGFGGFKANIQEDEDDFDFADEVAIDKPAFDFPDFETGEIKVEKPREPIRPFGLKQKPKVGDAPKGPIGEAIHRLLGLPGEPGKKAAEAEASVLSAIASDPVYAEMEPTQLGNLGCSVPEFVLASIEHLILEEVRAVTRDINARKENSDPTVADWSSPDQWVDIEED